jgi:hypothetical protein
MVVGGPFGLSMINPAHAVFTPSRVLHLLFGLITLLNL